MSQTQSSRPGPSIGELHEVRALFSSADAMHEAIERLEIAGFDRADLSLPEINPPPERATPEAGAKAADTEEDARQTRTLHSSTVGAIGAMAAAGAVIATGGGAAPAVAAAVFGGGLAGGLTHAISSAVNQDEQEDREIKAASGTLMLSVRAPNAAKRAEAEALLRATGATEVATV